MIRTQISFDVSLYQKARVAALRQGISLAELCRRSVAIAVAAEPTDKPWMTHAGMFEGRPDDSASIDQVVYGRDRP